MPSTTSENQSIMPERVGIAFIDSKLNGFTSKLPMDNMVKVCVSKRLHNFNGQVLCNYLEKP